MGQTHPRFIVTENASNVPSHDVLSSVSVDKAVVPDATTQTEIAIPKETSKTVSFTNTYTRKDADLTIVKKISDNVIDSVNNEFVFKVEQDKTNLAAGQIASGTYGSCTFTDGVAEITIAGEDSITIPGLPVGTYTVTEVTAGDIDLNNTQGKDFYLEKTEYQIGTGTATEIPVEVDLQSDTTVTVTNTYAPYKSLTVTKSIDGEMASSTEPFGFTITKTAQSGATASLAVEDVVGNENVTSIAGGATSNTITLDMKANGQVTIYNLKASDM